MNMYESSLQAMEHLLKRTHQSFWRKWIQKDIKAWQKNKSVSHHLSAYGGMGTFNDVVLWTPHHQFMSKEVEAWVDPLFMWLKSLCFILAQNPEKTYALSELKEHVGYHDASLSAFAGSEHASRKMRGLCDKPFPINGCQCLKCGYSEVTDSDIHNYVAHNMLPEIVFSACIENTLIELIDHVLELSLPNIDNILSSVREEIIKSDIAISSRDGFMESCPLCHSEKTASCRWIYVNAFFTPDKNNLKTMSITKAIHLLQQGRG